MGQEYPAYYGSEGYGAAVPDQNDFAAYEGSYGSAEDYAADTEVSSATDPYSGAEDFGDAGGDVGAAGIPGQNLVSFLGPGAPVRPALFDNWLNQGQGNLGTYPPTSQLPGAAAAARGGGAMSRYGAIMRRVAQTTGMRVRLATVLFLIAKLGWAAAASATGLGAQDLLWLFIRAKTKRRGHRGPHLFTIVKRCRQAARYRAMLSRTAQQCGGGGHRSYHRRRRPPFRALHRRHRRRK